MCVSNILKGEPRPVSGRFLKISKRGGDSKKAKVTRLKAKGGELWEV